jgi:hypothetical protein
VGLSDPQGVHNLFYIVDERLQGDRSNGDVTSALADTPGLDQDHLKASPGQSGGKT